jgi:hypothetical protein
MVSTRIEPFDVSRERMVEMANEYRELARELLNGTILLQATIVPWHDDRFRRMFASMAATQAHDAQQFRSVSAFVRALVLDAKT